MVIVRIWEGLGNQLFQYAYARALALRTGQRVYLDISEYKSGSAPVREYGLCHFRIRQPEVDCSRFLPFVSSDKLYSRNMKPFPIRLMKEKDCCYKKELCELGGFLYLKGWFQSEEYFKKFEGSIRKEIRPRENIRITKELRHILSGDSAVSVHVRRSDFKKSHNVLPVRYYENAKLAVSELVRVPRYVVFSDDMPWVKENLNFGDGCFYVDEKLGFKDYEELMVMSRCSHHIIANSTFSWWGAWLNADKNKVVIAPKKWFLNDIKDDFTPVPSGWVRV